MPRIKPLNKDGALTECKASIAKYMTLRGVSHQDMARCLGIKSLSTWYLHYKDPSKMSLAEYVAICKTLCIPREEQMHV